MQERRHKLVELGRIPLGRILVKGGMQRGDTMGLEDIAGIAAGEGIAAEEDIVVGEGTAAEGDIAEEDIAVAGTAEVVGKAFERVSAADSSLLQGSE